MMGKARNIGDLVTRYIPGASATESIGGYLCLEFRGARNSRTSGCNYPLIVVDGLPIAEAGRFLRDLQLIDIEKIQFVPASEGTVRYVASQPWPFPSSLMIGCQADALDDTITIDPQEIEDAQWFPRDQVRDMVANASTGEGLRMPPPLSLAYQLAAPQVSLGPTTPRVHSRVAGTGERAGLAA